MRSYVVTILFHTTYPFLLQVYCTIDKLVSHELGFILELENTRNFVITYTTVLGIPLVVIYTRPLTNKRNFMITMIININPSSKYFHRGGFSR